MPRFALNIPNRGWKPLPQKTEISCVTGIAVSWLKTLRFALLGLWRELRGGDLRLLGLALVLTVASVTSVGFFTDRVEGALLHQGNELLAANLVIESPDPPPEAFSDQALHLGLETSRSLSCSTASPASAASDSLP